MSEFKNIVARYAEMVEAGKYAEVIDIFYDEDIVQKENSDEPTRGKEVLRNNLIGEMESNKKVTTKIINLIAEAETEKVMGEMDIIVDNGDGTGIRIEEAFCQQWKQDKIVYQRYYWHSFQDIKPD